MRRFGWGLLFAIAAYLVAAVLGYLLVQVLSSNTHDRDLEAAMTGALVFGPLAALVGFVVGVIKGRARPASAVAECKPEQQQPPP